MTTCLLLGQLVNRRCCLAENNLILIIQEFGQLRDGTYGQVGIVLVVYQVHHGMFQHLGGFREVLDRSGLVRVDLGARESGCLPPGSRGTWQHGHAETVSD